MHGANSAGLTAVSATETGGRVTFRYDDKSYQTGGPDGGGERVAAWGFFILPRSSKTLLVEENVQRLTGRDPDWKERARFETGWISKGCYRSTHR